MDRIYFHAAREVSEKQLLHAIHHIMQATKVEWIENSYTYDGDFTPGVLYVERRIGAGQFKFGYEMQFVTERKPLTIREKIGVLQRLAKQFSLPTLAPTEDIDPYTFISIDDDGFASSVGVEPAPYNEKSEITIEGPYNFSFGGFALVEPLTYSEEMLLIELFREFMANFDVVNVGSELFNPDFRNYKSTSIPLRGYNHFYLLVPFGKNTWYSNEEKSTLFIEQMTRFCRESNKDVCLFPANSSTTANIPGGSDSERSCVNITATGIEKITYKPRRKTWLKD
jgi:hypothetical protein